MPERTISGCNGGSRCCHFAEEQEISIWGPKVVDILLVEDDPGDVFVTQEALADQKVINSLSVIDNGEDAVRYLRRQAEFADAPRPDLVILDLNLPRVSGREELAEIKGDPDLATIPVVILTTSSADQDVLESYQHHANAYVTKPVDFESFRQIVRQIDDFFISVVRRPTVQPALPNS